MGVVFNPQQWVDQTTHHKLEPLSSMGDFVEKETGKTKGFKKTSLLDYFQGVIIIIIWFGDTVTVSHPTKYNTNSKVRALS